MKHNPVLVFDADPAVYQAAFAAQSTVHHIVYETGRGEIKQRVWKDGNQALAFFRRFKKCKRLSHDKEVIWEEPSHARQCCRTIFNKSIRAACQHWGVDRGDIQTEVYLSGPDNFRVDLATITKYKDRKAPTPHHYQVVRNYIQEQWNAKVVHGIEADDQCSIRCHQLRADGIPYILATIDKDLDQVPGWHHNYSKNALYEVSEGEAEYFFWKQCLTGDATDSIQGLVKVGDITADELLSKWYEDKCSPEFMWEAVVACYMQNMEKYPEYYPEHMSAYEAALENARLVKMMDYEGQLWNPPGVPDGVLDGA